MRDQKSDRTHLLRQAQLDAAVHMPGRERIFVADHDDPAADAVRVPLEILRSAQAEIEDFRHEARRRCRAQKRRAWKRNARHRIESVAQSGIANRIFHRIGAKRCARHCRQPLLRRNQEPRLRSPSRRAGRRDRTAPGSPPTSAGRLGLTGGEADAPVDAASVTGALIPTDLTISAQRAVSLSIRARNCAGEAWDAVTPSGARRVANSGESRMALRSSAQACGDLRRQAGRSEHAPPMLDDEIDAAFPERRNTRLRVASRVSLATASVRTRSRTELAVAIVVKPDCT